MAGARKGAGLSLFIHSGVFPGGPSTSVRLQAESGSILTHAELLETLRQDAFIPREAELEPLSPGGGSRRYYRLAGEGPPRLLCLQPTPQTFGGNLDENRSFLYLARLIGERLGRAPRVLDVRLFGEAGGAGAFLLEDLGDTDLRTLVRQTPHEDGLLDLGRQAVELLLRLQRELEPPVFDARRCHSPPWDMRLLLEEESGPWREALLRDFLDLDLDHRALERECRELARRSAEVPRGHFIHRDFQSSNLLHHEGQWFLIDFQGARPGPLCYDLCSLVYDPYTALPPEVRLGMLEEYQELGKAFHGLSLEELQAQCALVGSQRLMQAQAAYLRISRDRQDASWLAHLRPAASALRELCDHEQLDSCPVLREAAWLAWDRLNRGDHS